MQTVSSTSTFVSAAPISRAVLLQNLPLGINLSVSLGGTIRGGPEMDDWTLEANTERRGVVDVCSVKSDPGTKARGTKLDDPKGRRTPSWSRMATIILIDYALVWYVCVDVAVLTAAGFLGAVGSLDSLSKRMSCYCDCAPAAVLRTAGAVCRGPPVRNPVLACVRPVYADVEHVSGSVSGVVLVWFRC